MPLDVSTRDTQVSYDTMNIVFNKLSNFYRTAKHDVVFATRKDSKQSISLPTNIRSYNEILINHHKTNDNLTLSRRQLLLDASDTSSLKDLAAHDHQNSPHLDGRILRFDATSNLSLDKYAKLTSIMYLITQLGISISFEFVEFLETRPDLKNELFDLVFSTHGDMVHSSKRYNKFSMHDPHINLLTKEFNNYIRAIIGHKRMSLDMSIQLSSFNNLCLLYSIVKNNVPEILTHEVWEKGYL